MHETAITPHSIRGILLLVVAAAFLLALLVRTARRSNDPAALFVKWFVSLLAIGFVIYMVRGALGLHLVPVALIVSAILILTWGRSIGTIFAKPFTMLYEDNTEVEPQPYYSVAEAKKKRGLYTEAVAEIRKQLAKFPADYQGQMLLAEIQAEHLDDLQGADLIVRRMLEQRGHSSSNLAFALNTLADWHLKHAQDSDAAREALQQVVTRFPETELAALATQRIAHLASTRQLLESHDPKRVPVPQGIRNLGLLKSSAHLAPIEPDPERRAASFVAQLEQHPGDTEAREKLAVIYADHYGRLDLAADQLEQLIAHPDLPAKSIVRWLNLLTDLQIRHGLDYDTVRQTLERIVERYPNHAAADVARNRMDLLKLEFKAKARNQNVKLGTYEQNIGLKYGPPKQGGE
jgi:outer membrane protein assembly factor BamD (BamD/ComL family)